MMRSLAAGCSPLTVMVTPGMAVEMSLVLLSMARSSTVTIALAAFWVTARPRPVASLSMVRPPLAALPIGLPVSRLVKER